jgi:hypothetical protein
LDAFECAIQAKEAGMRAIVFKDQFVPTIDWAFFANKYADGAESIGGVVLNMPVGGINKWAVDTAIRGGARVIWMPASHSKHCIANIMSRSQNREALTLYPPLEEAVGILDENDELIPEIFIILDQIYRANIVMNTGHLSTKESIKLLKAGQERGLKKMVVNHPLANLISATMEEMEEMVSYGAYLEHTFGKLMPHIDHIDPKLYAKAIKTFGAENNIMSTDTGLVNFPPPVESMRLYIEIMRWAGITDDEIVTMIRYNPMYLLDLE